MNALSVRVLLAAAACCAAASAPAEPRFDQLVLKATHNSYASEDPCFSCNSAPQITHPPEDQIDDFGVWAIELDIGVVEVDGNPTLMVGHNAGEGDDTWAHPTWRGPLRDWLSRIKDTHALVYRPIVITFEKKCWDDEAYNRMSTWLPMLEETICHVFCSGDCSTGCRIYGPDSLLADGCIWPSATELAGHVIASAFCGQSGEHACGGACRDQSSSLIFDDFVPEGFDVAGDESCWTLQGIQEEVADSNPANGLLITLDQFQEDWTYYDSDGWALGRKPAPPLPICVDPEAPSSWQLLDGVNNSAVFCRGNPGVPLTVTPQGTFRFPYRTLSRAIERATPGWTVLLKGGSYPGPRTLSSPIVLRATGGTAVLGE